MVVIDLSKNRIDDGFFVKNGREPSPYEWPADSGEPYLFLGTYQNSGSPIRDALLHLIRGAQQRLFVASFMIGDEAVLVELLNAASRLRGGVYIITALDERSLRRGLAEYEDQEQEPPEERRKNFNRLTTNGIYVRGHESCHAKFAVADDTIAIVGSANFVTNGFERTGEANVLIRERDQVRQLARLFISLWYEGCTWEIPPGETYQVAQRQPIRPPAIPDPPCVSAAGVTWTNQATDTFLHQSICDAIARAKRQVTLASYSVTGMIDKPHLLIEPLRDAIARGVSIRLFVRQQNPNSSQRADLCRLFDMGVEVYGDRLNHAKGVVADGILGALFSSNFDGAHGLDSGVEVGVRLDGHSALKDFEHYLDHAMKNADARFVRNPTLEQLDGKLAARWCQQWPWNLEMRVICKSADADNFLVEAANGPVLYENVAGGIRLFAGNTTLVLQQAGESAEGRVEPPIDGMPVFQRLESWLASVRGHGKNAAVSERGFCPARIAFSLV
jgi:phosphatidylserine/phosphatidylglycerophosphate/cardiolipin synthase-like enzyme